jgi:WD40 repeat protein
MQILNEGDSRLTKHLKLQMLQQKGKLFYQLADAFCGNSSWEDDETSREHIVDVEKTFLKGHKQAITCLEWTHDNRQIITGSKDCSLIQCKRNRIVVTSL